MLIGPRLQHTASIRPTPRSETLIKKESSIDKKAFFLLVLLSVFTKLEASQNLRFSKKTLLFSVENPHDKKIVHTDGKIELQLGYKKEKDGFSCATRILTQQNQSIPLDISYDFSHIGSQIQCKNKTIYDTAGHRKSIYIGYQANKVSSEITADQLTEYHYKEAAIDTYTGLRQAGGTQYFESLKHQHLGSTQVEIFNNGSSNQKRLLAETYIRQSVDGHDIYEIKKDYNKNLVENTLYSSIHQIFKGNSSETRHHYRVDFKDHANLRQSFFDEKGIKHTESSHSSLSTEFCVLTTVSIIFLAILGLALKGQIFSSAQKQNNQFGSSKVHLV